MQLALLAMVSVVVHPAPFDAKSVYNRVQSGVVTVRTDEKVGSGFVIGDGTLIVTCYHVVREDPTSIKVKGQPAELIAEDQRSDIAILRVRTRAGKPLAISAALPKPGTKIYVIGNPLGMLEKTISEGIVSAIRKNESLSLVQITAPISEGSSGGPVVDERGNVVAMVALTLTTGQALNFAVGTPRIRQSVHLATAAAKKRPFRIAKSKTITPAARLRRDIKSVIAGDLEPADLVKYGSAAIPYILEALKAPDDGVGFRSGLLFALMEFGDPIQSPLLNTLSNGTEWQRRDVAALIRMIAAMTAPSTVIAAPLPGREEWIEERRERQFRFVRSEEVKRGLIKAFRLHDVRRGSDQAAQALAYLGYREVNEEMMKATKHENHAMALSAFEALIVLLEPAEKDIARKAFDHVYAGTTKDDLDEDENNRRVAKMGEVLRKTRTAVGAELILQLLQHEDWEIRFAMCALLTERREMKALPLVKKLVEDDDEEVRWAALAAVANLARGEMLEKMAAYAKSSSEKDRRWGVYAAGLTRTEAGLEISLSRVEDPDTEVRRYVVGALARIGGEKARTALKKLAKDPDADVRGDAKEALEILDAEEENEAPRKTL